MIERKEEKHPSEGDQGTDLGQTHEDAFWGVVGLNEDWVETQLELDLILFNLENLAYPREGHTAQNVGRAVGSLKEVPQD